MSRILDREFYAQDAPAVARALLGATLVRQLDGARLSGTIVEIEAYSTPHDLASHGYAKRTARNLPMWNAPGHAYVYLIYGMYWLLNIVCEPVDHPAAVLIRAIEPREGLPVMAANRAGQPQRRWTSGPGRLARALAVDERDNRADMTTAAAGLWVEEAARVPDERVRSGPRVGLGSRVLEPWRSMPWRWWVADNPYVST